MDFPVRLCLSGENKTVSKKAGRGEDIKIKPFTIAKNGFHGYLYTPGVCIRPKMVLLILGGAGVPYRLTRDEAEFFAGLGYTALAIGYYGVPDAPKTCAKVPVEYVEKAVRYLWKKDFRKIAAIGISKGAELSLVSAGLLPEISGVIAMAPSCRINMGIGPGVSWLNCSSWTWRGKELPYAYARVKSGKVIFTSLKQREFSFSEVYEAANRNAGQSSLIPCEKICGPILLVSSEHDSIWPSRQSCENVMKRLKEHDFTYSCKHLNYRYGSHMLLPFKTRYQWLFQEGRKYPKEYDAAVASLREEIIRWLDEV